VGCVGWVWGRGASPPPPTPQTPIPNPQSPIPKKLFDFKNIKIFKLKLSNNKNK